MTTIDTVKDIIGDCNYYMADVFHVVLLLQKQLDEANANDWQVGSNLPPKPIPEDAVRVGQVKVRHGDSEYPLWVLPTPDHVQHEAQWNTTCIDCGVDGRMEVCSGVFIAEGMPLDAAEGFSFLDAKQVSTEDEWVQCQNCKSTWGLAFLEVDKG